MEEDLDRIANGEEERVAWLTRFFYGTEGDPGLQDLAADLGAIDAQEINTMKMGQGIEIRVGRYGAYLQQGEGDARKFANIPESLAPDELTLAIAIELLSQPSGERELGIDPATQLPVLAKSGRFGPYVTEVLPEGAKKSEKAKTASLLSTMTLDTIDIDDALKLLSLPRTLGEYDGTEITVQNGRYGPYLKHGVDSRTLTSEDQLFSMTFDEAVAIYKEPKVRRRGVAKPPLKDLGIDPGSGKSVLVKDGRFGIYVTDGDTNATLRRGDTVEFLTLERGTELLAGRRAWEAENGGATKVKKGGKKVAKKAPAKKAAVKKTTSRAKKTAPTLTKNTVKATGAAKSKKKAATGKGKTVAV